MKSLLLRTNSSHIVAILFFNPAHHACFPRYGTPAADCYSSEPMKDMAHPALITVANDDLRSFSDDVTYEPSAFMVDAARLIVGRLGGEGKFSTVSF